MLTCKYCQRTYTGPNPSGYHAGWGFLGFHYPGRTINIIHCPTHKDDAFKEMRSVVLRVLTKQPNEGGSHVQP